MEGSFKVLEPMTIKFIGDREVIRLQIKQAGSEIREFGVLIDIKPGNVRSIVSAAVIWGNDETVVVSYTGSDGTEFIAPLHLKWVEQHVSVLVNPSSGSYFEDLVCDNAEKAWSGEFFDWGRIKHAHRRALSAA